MNLTIPIMEGQTANITSMDGKTKETFTWMANYKQVRCFRMDKNKGVLVFSYDVIINEDLFVKGIGRNKRKCSKSTILKYPTDGGAK